MQLHQLQRPPHQTTASLAFSLANKMLMLFSENTVSMNLVALDVLVLDVPISGNMALADLSTLLVNTSTQRLTIPTT